MPVDLLDGRAGGHEQQHELVVGQAELVDEGDAGAGGGHVEQRDCLQAHLVQQAGAEAFG